MTRSTTTHVVTLADHLPKDDVATLLSEMRIHGRYFEAHFSFTTSLCYSYSREEELISTTLFPHIKTETYRNRALSGSGTAIIEIMTRSTRNRNRRTPLRQRPRRTTTTGTSSPIVVLLLLTLVLMAASSSCKVRAFSTTTCNHRHVRPPTSKMQSPTSRRTSTSLRSLVQLQDTTTTTDTVSLEWTEFFVPKVTQAETDTPVLFLHGLLGSKRNFSSLGRMLGVQLERPRRILGVDLRNHGDSGHAPDMSYHTMARDVLAFLDAMGLDRIVLVGHSMGGKVAQAMALLHPERVEGLVVLDVAPVSYCRERDAHWKAVEDILHAIHKVVVEQEEASSGRGGATEIDQALKQSIPDPALRAFVLTNYDNRKREWKIPIGTLVTQLERIAGFDLHESSQSSFEGDVFIIHGGQSRFVRHAYMDAIASYFPNHMLTTVRGAGHWVHAEAPDDVTALLKRYLDR